MLGRLASGAQPPPTPATTSTEPSSPDLGSAVPELVTRAPRKRPIPRKGHTKSRRGCLNCKRRRIKCQETLPECDHCKRLGLRCDYPRASDVVLSPSKALRATPTQFSMEDLRFFHHFLLNAYPSLPLNGEYVWKEVAALSHGFDFLIHAMLGLAASHLALSNGADYSSQALTHRVESIKSLNQALGTPCTSQADGDARFATVMALTFQSSYMHEGMMEFVSMVRGCTVVSGNGMLYAESVFRCFSPEDHNKALRSLGGGRSLDSKYYIDVDAAAASIRAIAPLCKSMLEVRYLGILQGIMRKAKTSYMDAVADVPVAYNLFGAASTEEFNVFTDPTNHTAQIILAHFFIIEYMLLAPIYQPVYDSFPFRKLIVATWVRDVADKLPGKYKQYVRWPLEFPSSMHIVDSGSG